MQRRTDTGNTAGDRSPDPTMRAYLATSVRNHARRAPATVAEDDVIAISPPEEGALDPEPVMACSGRRGY